MNHNKIFIFSNTSSLKQGYSIDWCKGPDRGLIAPDVVFYMEVPLKEASSRGGYGEERYETQSFQERVRGRYEQLKDPTWKVMLECRMLCLKLKGKHRVADFLSLGKNSPKVLAGTYTYILKKVWGKVKGT